MAYTEDNACMFANAFSAISKQGPVLTYSDEGSDPEYTEKDGGEYEEVEEDESDNEPVVSTWWKVLGVSPEASIAQIKSAYRGMQMQYHPDRVAHLGEKLRHLAEQEATAINAAYTEAMRLRRR